MGYDPIPVENLAGGLNLRDQPNLESGSFALDCLDVDFDGPTVRTRDGYDQFAAGVGAESYTSLHPYYSATGDRKIIAGIAGGGVRVFDAAGASVATTALTEGAHGLFYYATFGGPLETAAYIANGVDTLIKWNGSAFAVLTPTGPITPKPYFLAVTPWDNRLVGAAFGGTQAEGNSFSTVRFSQPGDPENWQDNYIELTPGDGEGISGILAWREYVFVFKRTKYFVFYGTSVGTSGQPEFNYRTVNVGIGCLRSPVAGPDGVYFLCDRGSPGVYRTTGADPELVSGPLDPIFHHRQADFSAIEPINFSETVSNAAKYRMSVFQKKILLNVPTGNSNTRTFVYDARTKAWTVWDLPLKAMTPFSLSSDEELVFSSDANPKIFRMGGQFTDDDGTPIPSFWQSGWIDGGNPFRKQVREWKLWGSGTILWKIYVNYRTASSSSDTVVFGDVPAAAKLSRIAARGIVFSVRAEGTDVFRLSKVIGHLREVSIPSKIT